MDTQYLKGVLKYVATAVLSIILIAYVMYHISGGFQTGIETESAVLATQEETLTVAATITRNEKIIYSTINGTVNYLYNDGERVSANTMVAEVFPNAASDEIRRKIIEIDRKIALLESSNMTDAEKRTDTSSTDTQIWKSIYSLLDYSDAGEISSIYAESEKLLVQLNRRKIITRITLNFDDIIDDLKNQRAALSSRLDTPETTVNTHYSGCFYSAIDGYEQVFDPELFPNITYLQYLALLNEKSQNYIGNGFGYPIGKVVNDYTWYLSCEINNDQRHNFEEGKYYSVKFPFNNGTSINMCLFRVVTDPQYETAILIFRTDIQPFDFNYSRNQTVRIVQKAYTGYRVPASAVRIVSGYRGVYILRGSKIEFRRIEPLIEYDGYFIVAEHENTVNDKVRWLAKNDFVVTKGKNIYDGKIIN